MVATHEGPCCNQCDSDYLTQEMGYPVCCCHQLMMEFEDATEIE
jgi:hypothetical protein